MVYCVYSNQILQTICADFSSPRGIVVHGEPRRWRDSLSRARPRPQWPQPIGGFRAIDKDLDPLNPLRQWKGGERDKGRKIPAAASFVGKV